MTSFFELCAAVKATDEERDALAWHLAMLRARRTVELLTAVRRRRRRSESAAISLMRSPGILSGPTPQKE